MPISKNKYKFIKVYRPPGTKYSSAQGRNLNEVITKAEQEFYKEFGYLPLQEHVVIEIIGVTGMWCVDFQEVKDDE